MNKPAGRILFLALIAFGNLIPSVRAEVEDTDVLQPGLHYAPLIIDGYELFSVRGVKMFKADERARQIEVKITKLARDTSFSTNLITIIEETDRSRIMGRDNLIVSVLDDDAALMGLNRQLFAQLAVSRISDAITRYRSEREPRYLAYQCGRALLATLVTALLLVGIFRIHRKMNDLVKARVVSRLEKNMKIQSFSLIQGDHLWRAYQGLANTLKIVVLLLILYFYIHRILNLFPWTRHAGVVLFDVLISPLKIILLGVVELIPNLVFLVILYFIFRYILKVVHAFFASVARGSVKLTGFEAEWAIPTYRIVRLLVVIFGMVVAYPYIPGSNTNAFKGISVFMGVMLSLGSSSLISNIMAGYSMTYRKAFKVGDRIRVGNFVGDVEEVRMMVTRLRTLKNEEVVIPNSMILNQEVVNYTALAQRDGLILHTTVGIGYETPWRQVEAMLLDAATKTGGIEKEPQPFVRQQSLGDFAVNYELNVFCRDPRSWPVIYTDLHRNILDVFNTYGVQIMTPAYEGDPDVPKIVPRDQWFTTPAKSQDPDSKRLSDTAKDPTA